jgi:hypothetical protein
MERSNRWMMPVVLLVLAAAVAYGMYRLFASPAESPIPSAMPPVSSAPPVPAPAVPTEPPVQFPLPGEAPEAALQAPVVPPEEALAAFSKALAAEIDANALARFLGTENLVRRTVSTVDNLGADQLPIGMRAVRPTPGGFVVTGQGDTLAISPDNARRYEPFVRFVESLDTRRAVALYTAHYRLFQGEYRGQGSPGRYFNDRLVASIDHLLATPVVTGPIRLVQPKVQYRFADPELESLSAGQKALIRMGPEHAARMKAKLKAVRAELTHQGRPPQPRTSP